MASLQGRIIMAFEQSWSVIVRVESNPFEGGSFVIQSIDTVENSIASRSGVIGKIGGLFRCVLLLFI
jgi:hypothetical protein